MQCFYFRKTELIVVAAVILILLALLIPYLLRSSAQATETTAANLLQLYAKGQHIWFNNLYSGQHSIRGGFAGYEDNRAGPGTSGGSLSDLAEARLWPVFRYNRNGKDTSKLNQVTNVKKLVVDANFVPEETLLGYGFLEDQNPGLHWAFDFGLFAYPVRSLWSNAHTLYIDTSTILHVSPLNNFDQTSSSQDQAIAHWIKPDFSTQSDLEENTADSPVTAENSDNTDE